MRSTVDLLTAYAAAEIICGMCKSGVINEFGTPVTAWEFAHAHRLDEVGVVTVLNFLAESTDMFRKNGDKFALAPEYAERRAWQALVIKFVAAYGPVMRDPLRSLGDLKHAHGCIDAESLTAAFSHESESEALVETILRLDPAGLLDIGCGQGALLNRICSARSIRAWGIDRNPRMCRAARKRLIQSDLSGHVTIRCGDAQDLGRLLSRMERAAIDVICACSFLNEWMASESLAVAMLMRLGRFFPGRTMVIMDYLGGHDARSPPGRYTRLTDLSQALSGQGIPPATHEGWRRIYEAAGARLLTAAESRTLDLHWFVHVVALPADSI